MAAFETVNELRLLDQETKYLVRAVHLARVIDIHFQSILLMKVLSFLVLALMRIFVDCFLFHHLVVLLCICSSKMIIQDIDCSFV